MRSGEKPPPLLPPKPPPMPPPAMDDTRDQIIAEQDAQIEALNSEVKGLRLTISIKDQALANSDRQIRALEIAADVQKHAATANRWEGRIEGFVIGFGAGYITSKVCP